MRFLFESTIIEKGEEFHCKVYEFKLYPGKFKAEVIDSPQKQITEIIFWKEGNGWKTNSSSHSAQHIAQTIGSEIAKKKN